MYAKKLIGMIAGKYLSFFLKGLDLAAQLLQQGRDHGLPGYVYYRQLCGLGEVKKFPDLNGSMPQDVIQALRTVYGYTQQSFSFFP